MSHIANPSIPQSPSPTATTSESDPQGPVPAPCPPAAGGHSPTRPSSSAVSPDEEDGGTAAQRNTYTATYSPEDNKLRLRALRRLDKETYDKVRAAGYIWAPKQDLFVAPMWTPAREALALELAGEIGDEDTSLVERAEARSERFDGYSERRAADAAGARAAVDQVSKRFEFGQPILVGHHSERRARKDAERIETGMRKAIKMWETSSYWTARAAGAVAAAKYKQLPAVRVRRIKTIEADKRRAEKASKAARETIAHWSAPGLDMARALALSGDGRAVSVSRCYPLAEFPRQPPASQYEGVKSLWSALEDGILTVEQARDMVLPACERVAAVNQRWIDHCDNRLAYERAMLAESGYVAPPKPKTKGDLPLLNYAGEVAYRSYGGNVERCEATGITKAEFAAIHTDYKGTRVSECGTHRVRIAILGRGADRGLATVYLTDSKQHERPGAAAVETQKAAEEAAAVEVARQRHARVLARAERQPQVDEAKAAAAPFVALREQLKAGVKVVVAEQLFPTPQPLAARMVELAQVAVHHLVLEPSAGTGAIWRELSGKRTAVEINPALADGLRQMCTQQDAVVCGDFMDLAPDGDMVGDGFDRIVMNPPFAKGQDLAHIRHALTMLRPGGRLVALCADGPRQNEELKPAILEMGGTWESIENAGFEGTGVRVAMLVVDAPPAV